jgi:class 3 adenylate cyclase
VADARIGDVPGTRPFVGRLHERTVARQMMQEVEQGSPAFLLVSGLVGIGKSALLRWTAGEARARGAQVCRVASSRASPLSPVTRLFAPWPEVSECARRAVAGFALPERRSVAVDELVGALAAQSSRRAVVLTIDDADQLDTASLILLEEIWTALGGQARGHAAVLVVVTAQDPLDPDGFAPRLLELEGARLLALGTLDDHAVFELVAAALGRPDPAVVDDLLDSTGGIPLLLEAEVERLVVARSQGAVAPAANPAGDIRVLRMREGFAGRFDKIDAQARNLLASAALLGEPFDPDELAAVTGVPPPAVDEAIDSAVHVRLVDRGIDGLRFSHPMIRIELLARLPVSRRRAIRRQIAEFLGGRREDRALDDATIVRVADQLVLAGDRLNSQAEADIAERAGAVAMRQRAWHQASRLLSAAAGAARREGPPDRVAELYLDAALAAYFDHDVAQCEHHLTRAIACARDADDRAQELRAATLLVRARAAERPFRPGDRPDVAELDEALLRYGEGPLAVEAEAVRAEALLASGDTTAALELVASTRARAATLVPVPRQGLCRLEFTEGIHRLSVLDLDRADRCLRRGLTHAVASGDNLELALRSRRALVAILRGHLADAEATLRELEDVAITRRLWGEAGYATAQLALISALAGAADGRQTVERGVRLYRRSGHLYTGALLTPVAAALAARVAGPDLASSDLLAGSDIRPSTAVAVLAAVEAGDVAATTRSLGDAHWRHGLRVEPSHSSLTIATALVEAGDLLDDGSLVSAGAPVLDLAAERGMEVTLGWPATVARLRAIAARHGGEEDDAVRYIDHAATLCRRQGLGAEYAKVVLELTRQQAGRHGTSAQSAAMLSDAAMRFDQLSMGGWLGRCSALADELGLPPVAGELQAVGDCTILTTDIVSSTATNARLGNADYLEQLRVHDRLIRARLRESHGREIKHTGDGFNAVFHDAGEGVRCALAIQGDFRRWTDREPALALRVRCGLARGAAIASGGDLFGLVQSEAARLCAMAAPGEILGSATIALALDARDVRVVSLGGHRLAGLPDESEVFRLLPPT